MSRDEPNHIVCDYVIVGSGLTGSVIARALHDAGREVVLIEKRPHHGGNVHDETHATGIRIHSYGPHYFRTNSQRIWEFINRFTEFYPYEAALKSLVDGQYENWPIAASYIRQHIGDSWQPDFTGKPTNFEEAALSLMPREIYEKFVKGYTQKQWGVEPKQLAADLCKRFDVREDDEPRLKPDCQYQGIPLHGYTAMMTNMIRGIDLRMPCDYLAHRREIQARKLLVFTGPIDAYFNFKFGDLKYRSQHRRHEFRPVVHYVQPCGQVNNPALDQGEHIRTLEWKHMMPEREAIQIKGTVLTREIPYTPKRGELGEYPFPDDANASLYQQYRRLADDLDDVLICGRLGEYRYFDMDQAIGRAMMLAERILDGDKPRLARNTH